VRGGCFRRGQIVNVALYTEIGMRCHVQYLRAWAREVGWI